jgi:glycerol uptake facilitator-like aquaporin
MSVHRALPQALVGEILGTYLLVLFGTGSVAAAVLTGAQVGLWQVAVVWGFGVTIAIYASATLSGAHLNPAVSLAFALLRRHDFPLTRLLPYIGAQLLGAVLASATVAALFWPFLLRFEAAKGLVRGAPGSELSAMVFGEYFPNPAMFGTDAAARALVAPWQAACVEGFGTAVLVLVIFALNHPEESRRAISELGAVLYRLYRRGPHQPLCAYHPGGMESRAGFWAAGRRLFSGLGKHRHSGAGRRLLGVSRGAPHWGAAGRARLDGAGGRYRAGRARDPAGAPPRGAPPTLYLNHGEVGVLAWTCSA